jgi:hypothetical protein
MVHILEQQPPRASSVLIQDQKLHLVVLMPLRTTGSPRRSLSAVCDAEIVLFDDCSVWHISKISAKKAEQLSGKE